MYFLLQFIFDWKSNLLLNYNTSDLEDFSIQCEENLFPAKKLQEETQEVTWMLTLSFVNITL